MESFFPPTSKTYVGKKPKANEAKVESLSALGENIDQSKTARMEEGDVLRMVWMKELKTVGLQASSGIWNVYKLMALIIKFT